MAISEEVDILEHQLFLQRDARDPLGVWNARHPITGDASSGSIKVAARVPAERSGSRIYTAYSVNIAGLSGAGLGAAAKCRLLTNLPDADVAAGVQGYSTLLLSGGDNQFTFSSGMSAPNAGLAKNYITSLDRFILLFGVPGQATNIIELEISSNIDLATYSFEYYGYFWDREVLYAAGGPRHPGSD